MSKQLRIVVYLKYTKQNERMLYVLPQYSVHNFIQKPHCLKMHSSLWRSIYIFNVKKQQEKEIKKLVVLNNANAY